VLCGLEIGWHLGLSGHSDADVATHAVIDAVLGAAGLGDIGALFPDTDPAYEGASSLALLREVVTRATGAGWRVVNVDLVIVAEQPKLAAQRDAMKALLAGALQVTGDAVGVKATTTEGMGFEGRGEGISATAVCLLEQASEG
jgi:2-C-methyl-D-erythritol 2,4-cyclodiphosphate synthase